MIYKKVLYLPELKQILFIKKENRAVHTLLYDITDMTQKPVANDILKNDLPWPYPADAKAGTFAPESYEAIIYAVTGVNYKEERERGLKPYILLDESNVDDGDELYICIHYSWAEEYEKESGKSYTVFEHESPIATGTCDLKEAKKKMKDMAVKEVETAGKDHGCSIGLQFSFEKNDLSAKEAVPCINLHYTYDNTYCYYRLYRKRSLDAWERSLQCKTA